MCVCLGQAAPGQRGRPTETGCFLQRAGGPAGGEGEFVPWTNLKSVRIWTKAKLICNPTD